MWIATAQAGRPRVLCSVTKVPHAQPTGCGPDRDGCVCMLLVVRSLLVSRKNTCGWFWGRRVMGCDDGGRVM